MQSGCMPLRLAHTNCRKCSLCAAQSFRFREFQDWGLGWEGPSNVLWLVFAASVFGLEFRITESVKGVPVHATYLNCMYEGSRSSCGLGFKACSV